MQFKYLARKAIIEASKKKEKKKKVYQTSDSFNTITAVPKADTVTNLTSGNGR